MSRTGTPVQSFLGSGYSGINIVLTPSVNSAEEFAVRCLIDKQVVLSQTLEGPLAPHIGRFAESLREQGYTRTVNAPHVEQADAGLCPEGHWELQDRKLL